MSRLSALVTTIGLLLLLASVWQIAAAGWGLEITTISTLPPLTIVRLAEPTPLSRPVVLIGHGFAGSGTLMRAFAFTLARAGYTAILWDFDGHGANSRPLAMDSLLANAEAALSEAKARNLVMPGKVAILGHSMGTAAALQFGQAYPDTAATIAVSPVGQTVTKELPRNLLLLAGSLEQPFVRNAQARLAEAGGAGGDPQKGTARKLIIIQGVEHISILFAPATHRTVVAWLDEIFGRQPGAAAYTDVRMLWYGLGVVSVLLIATALAPAFGAGTRKATAVLKRPLWWRVGALLGGALSATLILGLLGISGVRLSGVFGVLVGGYLMLWFAIAGLVSLLLLWAKPSLPTQRETVAGLVVFAVLWLGVGLLAHTVWYPWLLIWPRLKLWPLAVGCLLPWFMAVGQVTNGTGLASHLGRWLVHSLVLLGGWLLAVVITPQIGFLTLILFALPIVLLIHTLMAVPYRSWWPYALSGAPFLGWMLLALFPLQ